MIIKATYRIILFLLITVFVLNSCATSKDTPCPDFSNNKSYSKKYLADSRFEKRYKNYYVRKSNQNAFQINNIQKFSLSNSRDYTINPDKTYNTESFKIPGRK